MSNLLSSFTRNKRGPSGSAGTSTAPPSARRWNVALPAAAQTFLEQLVDLQLLTSEQVLTFLEQHPERLADFRMEATLGQELVQNGLLSRYQWQRILKGHTHGLILGNYRVLEEIAKGGMGVVYLGEHRLMRRRVALKVLPYDEHCHYSLRERFYAEMRALAELNHPNIIQAYDAGELPPPGPNMPALIYLVMELVSGGDLESYVDRHGPRPVAQACDWIRQAAQGLQASHDLHLIHRDLKPSNLLLTVQGQVKVTDFGLARQFCSQLTDPRNLLGSVEFMPPEQSYDPSGVDKAADIYGLGATLFWLLTRQTPYPPQSSVGQALRMLQSESPRRVRDLRPDVPAALDEFLAAMLHRDPDRRPGNALAVCTALTPFTLPQGGQSLRPSLLSSGSRDVLLANLTPTATTQTRALVLVGDAARGELVETTLRTLGCRSLRVHDAREAQQQNQQERFSLIVLDRDLLGAEGIRLCRHFREHPVLPFQKIVLLTAQDDPQAALDSLHAGADDHLGGPLSAELLQARVEGALRGKETLDRLLATAEQLQATNRQLQQSLQARSADVRHAHDALLFTMTKMAESNDGETGTHMKRVAAYAVLLAQEAARRPPWRGLVDDHFLTQLERCAPLHDIGKIGLPDEILLKPASLSTAERTLVETHPLIGDRILAALGKEYGEALDFLGMARAIVRHHHEHFDGTGYPDRLVGDAIPAAARLVAVADVYDALRRQRLHKPAMTHASTMRLMLGRGASQFDPILLQAFEACQDQFERIFREISE